MTLTLGSLRRCFEGAVPAAIATCDLGGVPNVAYLSQVHFVDRDHVALSFQFFNTTRRNILVNPRATLQVIDPESAEYYRLGIRYLHTETEGPLFEHMKAKLAGIASHSGMSKIFRLQGSDVYQVLSIERVPGESGVVAPSSAPEVLPGLRCCTRRLSACGDLSCLLDETLACLESAFGMAHSMLLMLDPNGKRLYTVASRGYPESGVGSEIALGEGIIGVAARERTPIRIGHMAQEYLYSCAVRQSFLQSGAAPDLETEIPLSGLPESRSQLAVPIVHGSRLLGMLYVESPEDMRFTWEEEDALVTLMDYLAAAILVHEQTDAPGPAPAPAAPMVPQGKPVEVRYYPADQSVFIDNDYLIKGVAGAIIWKLLRDHTEQGRQDFTNRELRLDPSLRLPDIVNNLEARLILLQRRLAERCPFMTIEKAGRGRFRLVVSRILCLTEVKG